MVSNNSKILETLKEVNGSITTTELANRTNIDITNISRYLKVLEKEGLVRRETVQKGKLRLVNISLLLEKPSIEVKSEVIQEVKEVVSKPVSVLEKPIPKIIPKSKPIQETEFSKLTIDELRAYYIVICKKSPKHNSTQTKEVLINEIIEKLKQSI